MSFFIIRTKHIFGAYHLQSLQDTVIIVVFPPDRFLPWHLVCLLFAVFGACFLLFTIAKVNMCRDLLFLSLSFTNRHSSSHSWAIHWTRREKVKKKKKKEPDNQKRKFKTIMIIWSRFFDLLLEPLQYLLLTGLILS